MQMWMLFLQEWMSYVPSWPSSNCPSSEAAIVVVLLHRHLRHNLFWLCYSLRLPWTRACGLQTFSLGFYKLGKLRLSRRGPLRRMMGLLLLVFVIVLIIKSILSHSLVIGPPRRVDTLYVRA